MLNSSGNRREHVRQFIDPFNQLFILMHLTRQIFINPLKLFNKLINRFVEDFHVILFLSGL